MVTALTARTLARHGWLIAGMAAVLAGFQVLLVVIGANVQRQGIFTQINAFVPASLQTAFGGGLLASFGGFVTLGFFHPVVVLALAIGAGYVAGELAGDVEEGLVDLLAARPVPRGVLVTRAALAMLLPAAGTVALMLAASRIATTLNAPAGTPVPPAAALTWLAANVLAVTWCCGAIGLVLASALRRRTTAAGAAAILFVSLYLLDFAATWWAPARPFARLAPFHYFDPMPIMTGTHDPTRHIAGLLAATTVLAAVAFVVYQRRDL